MTELTPAQGLGKQGKLVHASSLSPAAAGALVKPCLNILSGLNQFLLAVKAKDTGSVTPVLLESEDLAGETDDSAKAKANR